ncbi:hypothetical protein HK097_010385 [Rhizophlyctis rosea]|uniref:Enoyl reductase (ER) domain-containing protein n=1 Tax=Rhizophlyctis rosea TaxID=64517 RepID=A0AAD5S7M9_9FUNG|nr:hypothetical protein HK097_010385 [Rhizophlyctis rosea]
MKAIGHTRNGPADDVLEEREVPVPTLSNPWDILVRVKAVSVNPVDTKRRSIHPIGENTFRILGYDASGIVEAVGSSVTRFKKGDEVAYAGAIGRDGSNAEFQLVDSRIVGRKPKSLGYAQAAAYPLVGLTAWEGLFEGAGIPVDGKGAEGKKLLVIGGAGGVGSLVIQLAKKLAHLTVIATASRSESQKFAQSLGADHVIDHSRNLKEELKKIGIDSVDYIYNTQSTEHYFEQAVDVLGVTGKLILINETDEKLPLGKLMSKRLSVIYELMFTRPIFGVELEKQGAILDRLAELIESGTLKSTEGHVEKWSLAGLKSVHKQLESHRTVGKVVLEF